MTINAQIFENNDKRDLNRQLKALLSLIPRSLLRPSRLKSWAYLTFDVCMVIGLAYFGNYAWESESYPLMGVYVFLQGSFFWSIFLIGHDSGHNSFSSRPWENLLSGYLTHSFLLVPFYAWKLSHQKHHAYHNMVERDETHVALPKSLVEDFERNLASRSLKFKSWVLLYMVLSNLSLTFIIYLLDSHILKEGSFNHFDPREDFFKRHRKPIMLSLVMVIVMLCLLGVAAAMSSLKFVAFLYFMPWLVFHLWIYFVTYLQHINDKNFWFYGEDWHFLKGAMQTVDYDFGKFVGPIINFFHHNIERYHFVHHLNPSIPHYGLKAAHGAIYEKVAEVYRLERKPFRNFIQFKYRRDLFVVEDKVEGRKSYSLFSLKSNDCKNRL